MDDDTSSIDSSIFQEEEDEPYAPYYDSNLPNPSQGSNNYAEGCTSNQARSEAILHFTAMGFRDELVIKTVDEYGEENSEAIVDALLSYKAAEELCQQGDPVVSCLRSPESNSLHEDFSDFSDSESISLEDLCDFSDAESYLQNEEDLELLPETKLKHLVSMGFSADEARRAIESSDLGTSITELMDYISAAQMAETTSSGHPHEISADMKKKKKLVEHEYEPEKRTDFKKRKRHLLSDKDEADRKIPKLVGFGVPSYPRCEFKRWLPDIAVGPPFFYFENVALAPKGVWNTMSQCLFNILPEFVDSRYFCAAARKRGYIHNLPTENRTALLPMLPMTIEEALPYTFPFWPSWDVRKHLNCLLRSTGSSKDRERIRELLEPYWQQDPPKDIVAKVLKDCRKWNYVWIGKNKVAQLLPDEMEHLLGYPKNHTRGGGVSDDQRYRALGNSFQVNTIAYHLSVLRNHFPKGIRVLSLFSGIGGAEIALHRLGIPLRFVVSVEMCEKNRNILRSWWEGTRQTGFLMDHITDVRELTTEKIRWLIRIDNGFDLVIGGSPCNNLSGMNRLTRTGLEGAHSILFFDFCRILKTVMRLMRGEL